MIVVDASVLIAHLDDRDAQHDRAVRELAEHATQPFAASAITLAEVLVGPARNGRLHAAQAALSALGVQEIPLGAGAPGRLATLRAETALKLPDCCVLEAAQRVGASAILTLDERLRSAAASLGLA